MAVEWFPGDFRLGRLRMDGAAPEHDGETTVDAKMLVIVQLEGRQAFCIGGRTVTLDAPAVAAISIRSPVPMTPILTEGPVRKLALAMPHAWMESFATEADTLFSRRAALQIRCWTPGDATQAQAGALMEETGRMTRFALAVALLQLLLAEARQTSLLAPRRLIRAARSDVVTCDAERVGMVRRVIAEHRGGPLSAVEVARACGLSLRTLERSWRRSCDSSLGEHLRDAMMRAGLAALGIPGATIAEAAWAAGYSSPANFATAVRARYGCSPSDLRAAQVTV